MVMRSRYSRSGASRLPLLIGIPRVVFEPSITEPVYVRSHIQRHAGWMRAHPTAAEGQLRKILDSLNGGVLRGRFDTQHAISRRWIVDFFFPEVRLAIEVDGAIHGTEEQKTSDSKKERDCARFDITLLRVTNADVFGDRDKLIQKLRRGWRMALDRENRIIGKAHRPSKPAREIGSSPILERQR